MIDIRIQEIYSEVYSILNLLGKEHINKLPISLFSMIKNNRKKEYNPTYNPNISLKEQKIKKESLATIALLHLNYWCKTEEEKIKLKKLFNQNEKKYQTEIREKYNPDNIFKN